VRFVAFVSLTLVTSIPVGCIGLDDRTLTLADGGEGGSDDGSGASTSGGSRNTGGSDEGGAPGGAGEAGASSSSSGSGNGSGATPGWAGAPPVDCTADIDLNQVPDCEETLLENAGFDLDIDGWTVGDFASLVWDFSDGSHSFSSGSLSVTNIATGIAGQGSARQCLKVEPGATYVAHVQGFIPGGQTLTGSARLEAIQFERDDCDAGLEPGEDPTELQVDVTSSEIVLEWVLLQNQVITTEKTGSLLFRLVADKAEGDPYFQVLFDNALLKIEAE
jgi:hypothetical protein